MNELFFSMSSRSNKLSGFESLFWNCFTEESVPFMSPEISLHLWNVAVKESKFCSVCCEKKFEILSSIL